MRTLPGPEEVNVIAKIRPSSNLNIDQLARAIDNLDQTIRQTLSIVADLRLTNGDWAFRDFRGHKWQRVKKRENQSYLKNAYRVLLTRARQGMVIFVPPGDLKVHTRPPGFYDPTYRYLTRPGLATL